MKVGFEGDILINLQDETSNSSAFNLLPGMCALMFVFCLIWRKKQDKKKKTSGGETFGNLLVWSKKRGKHPVKCLSRDRQLVEVSASLKEA